MTIQKLTLMKKTHLDDLGISYVEDPNLVRGLDYYTHTAFELMMDNPNYDGAITTLCGGRYNGLFELLDGPNQTGIGFALSIERLLLALEEEGIELTSRIRLIFYRYYG